MRPRLFLLTALIAAGMCGCTDPVSTSPLTSGERRPASPPSVTSADFLAKGSQVVSARKLESHPPANVKVSHLKPVLTVPVDIVREGAVTFVAHVRRNDGFDPDVVTFTPPSDASFEMEWGGLSSRCAADPAVDDCTIQVVVTISSMTNTYPGFRMWVF
jgi:hypothetical protein